MDYEEIEWRLTESIRQLIINQWQLGSLDVAERSVTSHLFRYIADTFADTGYDVDHEYNRQGSLTKYLSYGSGDDEGVRRIYPDIVVHTRNRDDANLVAMEVKKGAENDSNDHDKIRALVTDDAFLYEWGIVLALGIENRNPLGRIWAPHWMWLTLDVDRWQLSTSYVGPVVSEDELEYLNRTGSDLS